MKNNLRTISMLILMTFVWNTSSFGQDQMYDICPLKVGEDIPNTALVNNEDVKLNLLDMIEGKQTVIVFYRGAWCGYCIRHLAELNDIKNDIEEMGYQIFGITPDRYENLEKSNEKSESEIAVYSDSNLETIKAFGLDWEVDDELFDKYKNKYNLDLEEWSGEDHHALPVPAIFIINENKIAFQYVNPNYKTRLKAETLLSLLRTL